MAAKNTMKLWRCPKCSEEVEAIATQVSHRCRNNKNIDTNWVLVEGK
jgi:ABC-type ATPase with predicted acetyltransferase domain